MRLGAWALLLVAVLAAAAHAHSVSDVQNLNTFREGIKATKENRVSLFMWYTPHCALCDRMMDKRDGPFRVLSTMLEKEEKKRGWPRGSVILYKMNAFNWETVAREEGITKFPTLMLYGHGRVGHGEVVYEPGGKRNRVEPTDPDSMLALLVREAKEMLDRVDAAKEDADL